MTNAEKFTGVFIPAWVISLRLPSQAEKLYSIILSLQGAAGCYASTKYLGEVLGVSERQARDWLKLLKERGLVYQGKTDGRKRWLIAVMDSPEVNKKTRAAENRHPARRKTAGQTGTKPPGLPYIDSKVNNPPTEGQTLNGLARDVFLLHYVNWVGSAYPYWEAKDAGSLARLLKKLRVIIEEYKGEVITEQGLLEAFEDLLTKVGIIADEFIISNFNPTYLNSNLNTLITKIKLSQNEQFKNKLRDTREKLRADDRARGWASLFCRPNQERPGGNS